MPPQSPLKCIILIMNIEHMNKFHRNPGSEYETILKILKIQWVELRTVKNLQDKMIQGTVSFLLCAIDMQAD